jgi:hypothetical protein
MKAKKDTKMAAGLATREKGYHGEVHGHCREFEHFQAELLFPDNNRNQTALRTGIF